MIIYFKLYINSLSSYTYTNKERKIPKLYTKINELTNERKLFGENFEVERFVFDIEEESNFNIMQRNQNDKEKENDIEIYNFSNSMAPRPNFKKYRKSNGCLPCQPKAYREEDDSCCVIF